MKSKGMRLFLFIFLSGIIIGCGAGSNSKKKDEAATTKFTLPQVPAILTSAEERATYLVEHYWDNFNFADTSMISKPEITEQAFVDYLQVLPYAEPPKMEASIGKLLEASMNGSSAMFRHFEELFDKYLYDPNSPFRNEDQYIPVLKYIVASPKVSDVEKERPNYRLTMAMKNRPGDLANDFTYTLANGKQGKLSSIAADYLLLFFNNPDCEECKRIKEHIAQSEIMKNKKVKVLAFYTDKDLDSWKKAVYPKEWINGYDKDSTVSDTNLYDLKAIPTLYLLDKEKRVILKDVPIEQLEVFLSQN